MEWISVDIEMPKALMNVLVIVKIKICTLFQKAGMQIQLILVMSIQVTFWKVR